MITVAGLLLGLLVGLRHAFEPDHLTAIATLASESRGLRRGAVVGAIWGVGHTIALVAVGLALVLIGDALPARLAAAFELSVAVVLVLLGIRAIARALREGGTGDTSEHAHGGVLHRHPTMAAHLHLGRFALAWRPLAVGLVHGLAGSGALTALVFARLDGTSARLVYIGCFGLGSIVGMAVASAVAAFSFGAVPARIRRPMTLVAGSLSIVLGVAWSIPLYAAVV